MSLSLSSLQSKPQEDSVHQRQYNAVILTTALANSGLSFVVFSSPLLFQAWEHTSLFKAELLADKVQEDCREDNEDSKCRQKPISLGSNWEQKVRKNTSEQARKTAERKMGFNHS